MAYINQIFEWEGDSTQPYPTNYTWKGKKHLTPVKSTFGVARVIATFQDREDYYAELAARNQIIARNSARISAGSLLGLLGDEELGDRDLDGDILEDVPTVGDYSGDFYCTFKLFANSVLKFIKEIYSDHPFRVSGGYRSRTWEIQIEGNVIVKRVDVAGSMDELKRLDKEEGD